MTRPMTIYARSQFIRRVHSYTTLRYVRFIKHLGTKNYLYILRLTGNSRFQINIIYIHAVKTAGIGNGRRHVEGIRYIRVQRTEVQLLLPGRGIFFFIEIRTDSFLQFRFLSQAKYRQLKLISRTPDI